MAKGIIWVELIVINIPFTFTEGNVAKWLQDLISFHSTYDPPEIILFSGTEKVKTEKKEKKQKNKFHKAIASPFA